MVGLGAIGARVANMAVHLDMEVLGYDPYISVDAAWSLSRSVKHCLDLGKLLAECDYVTLHLPVTPDTKGLLNDRTFSQMKPGARLLNFARGELVDEAALKNALDAGRVAAYVTDFPTAGLLGDERCVCVPHLGASTPESEDNCAKMAVKEISDYLETGTIRNSVNFPNLKVPYEGGYRICMIHKNIPNMIASITSAVRCNIENMGNRSKGDYAYTIIDTAEAPTEANLDELRAIEGMISVRTI